MDIHRLRLDGSEAHIASRGAELQRLRLGGRDLLWDAGPLWPRHAPLLFPVVGGLRGDLLRHGGRTYPMPKHGFARDREFSWVHRGERACELELREDPATLALFPFPFRLRVSFALEPNRLHMGVDLQNPGPEPLPASLGLHPAFRWPLVPGAPKAGHHLVFETGEPGPLRRIDGQGLLTAEAHPTPIQDRILALREDLFREDALIFLEPHSRSLRYETEGGPTLRLDWEGFPHLGVWAKSDPGPSFLCVEPWEGHASPADWDGEFREKPGGFVLAPGAIRRWRMGFGL